MWRYKQPTKIIFGRGVREGLPEQLAPIGHRPVLVTDSTLAKLPVIAEVRHLLADDAPLFSDVEPNPTVASVDALAQLLVAHDADVQSGR